VARVALHPLPWHHPGDIPSLTRPADNPAIPSNHSQTDPPSGRCRLTWAAKHRICTLA